MEKKVEKLISRKELEKHIDILEKQGYKVEHFTMTVGKDDNIDY